MALAPFTNRGCWKNEQSTIPIPLNQVGPVPFCVGPVPETQNFTRPGGVTSWGHENQYRSLSLTTRKPCHTRLCRLKDARRLERLAAWIKREVYGGVGITYNAT